MSDSTELLSVTTHKEEAAPRIDYDAVDRHNLREKLDSCIDPLKPEEHTAGILNIVSGRKDPDSVNVDNAGMGNFRINPDFRIENFHFKHEISLLHLFTRPSFCVKSSYFGLMYA